MDRFENIQNIKEQFNNLLSMKNKSACVGLVKQVMDHKTLTIPQLYEEVLAPSLSSIAGNNIEQQMNIWEEHVQSSIVRTIVEMCYPYVLEVSMEEREDQAKDSLTTGSGEVIKPIAIVLCPEEEYHELGARMTTDFLTLLGFDAFFIGANTPKEEVYKAVEALRPRIICISVTNFYHLFKAEAMIVELRKKGSALDMRNVSIVVGGYAVEHTSNTKQSLHADYFVRSYADLKKIKEAIV